MTFKFDMQGTRKALISELRGRGMSVSGMDSSTLTQDIIDSAKRQSEAAGLDFAPLRSRLHAILDEFEAESASEAAVFPGVREALRRLLSHSVRLAVLTNSGRRSAYAVLRRGEILDDFEFILTREDVETMKPSPEGILEALRRFGLGRDEMYYVGDGILDAVAARRAGVRFVAVSTGSYQSTRLRAQGADYVVGSLEELERLAG